MKKILDKLRSGKDISREELIYIYKNINDSDLEELMNMANKIRLENYGNKVFARGLVEISSFCTKDCKYCGINILNKDAKRFRLSLEDIIDSCKKGYRLGFRSFVLQGGEDPYFTDDMIIEIVKAIKSELENVAVTLSIGEKTYESYEAFYRAGVDRFLLRHETINKKLFEEIHETASYDNRINALYNLKEIGYAVGAGFMVGIPGQSYEDLADDILFLKKLNPEMVGLGPFLPHKETVYKSEEKGNLRETLISLALVRILIPDVLLPATTALSTLDKNGRKLGFDAGANVIMPNLSPKDNIEKYSLYNDKLNTGIESADNIQAIENSMEAMGYVISKERGDNIRRKICL